METTKKNNKAASEQNESYELWEKQKKLRYCQELIFSSKELPEFAKQLIVNVCHAPIEEAIYDGISSKIKEGAPYNSYIMAGARLYYLQVQLNRKVGRTAYNNTFPDKTLLRYILAELRRHRPEFDVLLGVEKGQELPEATKERVKQEIFSAFLQSYPVFCVHKTNSDAVIRALKEHFKGREEIKYQELSDFLDFNDGVEGMEADEDPNTDFYTCMISYMKNGMNGDLIKTENGLLKQLDRTRRDSFKKKLPNKNELYWISIAIGADLRQFQKMRNLLLKESPNLYMYVDNDYNDRDAKIQTVLMDITAWTEAARRKNPLGYLKQLITDVNETLEKNGFENLYAKMPVSECMAAKPLIDGLQVTK